MKTHNHLFERICSFENLIAAAHLAERGKRFQHTIGVFSTNREREVLRLREELLSGNYQPGGYREKIITRPKTRMISAAPFRDRVVHHALCRVAMPLFEAKMIHDLYSNRKGKGTHAAIRRCQEFIRNHEYVLKCDVRKFFDSVDQNILFDVFRKKIKDAKTTSLLEEIIGSYRSSGILRERERERVKHCRFLTTKEYQSAI